MACDIYLRDKPVTLFGFDLSALSYKFELV